MRAIVSGVLLMTGLTMSAPAAGGTDVPEAELAKVRAALPEKAFVQPQQPRKLLVFTLCRGFRHDVIPLGAEALRLMGERTGAYQATISDDISLFEPDKLAQFDAVCFMNSTGELFEPAAAAEDAKKKNDQQDELAQGLAKLRELQRQQTLLDFVRGGKGLVGVHAATDLFYKWPAFGEMMGGYFDGHPWNETVAVKIDEPGHPLVTMFAGPFEIADEIYQFKAPYSRKNLRVLLSLDTSRTNMRKDGIKRTDGDFAVTWVRPYGSGRVFYCSLGHRHDIFWNPQVLAHYLAGIQFALGDLKAEAAPLVNSEPAKSEPPRSEPEAQARDRGIEGSRDQEKDKKGTGKREQGTEKSSEAWLALFNGKDLTGWQCPPNSWTVENGTLARKESGDIWTTEQYGDFVLELEFKIDPGANSGVFFRTANLKDPVQTGIEIQVLDSYGKQEVGKHDCGAVYDCVAPSKNAVRPPGEWNHVRLECIGPRIKIALNREPIIDMDLDQWTEPGKNPDGTGNKFATAYKDMPRRGYIGFQNYGNPIWYRNIRIQPK